MTAPLVRVFVGFDVRQPIAAQVAMYSVYRNCSAPVSMTPLVLSQLPIKRVGLSQFTYSRFLVPYLSGYDGISIFLDSDVLVRGDLAELLAYPLMEPKTPVFVVKGSKKFEWASVMVFNNKLCQMLTPSYIDNPKLNPLAFEWAHTVGELPNVWNHLVGYDAPDPDAKLVHLTMGIPVWEETKHCEFADEWHAVMKASASTCSFHQLMGKSVHPIARQKVVA